MYMHLKDDCPQRGAEASESGPPFGGQGVATEKQHGQRSGWRALALLVGQKGGIPSAEELGSPRAGRVCFWMVCESLAGQDSNSHIRSSFFFSSFLSSSANI
jgi:hypothetical protein